MTDYSSQGWTLERNLINPSGLKNHQSMYTALSRATTAKGTVLLQSFDSKKITGGISGDLRQEFRELEILNEITHLKYEQKLPTNVTGLTRNELIHSYRQWKGHSYVPDQVPDEIKWDRKDVFRTVRAPLLPWRILDESQKIKESELPKSSITGDFVPAIGSSPLKRPHSPTEDSVPPGKRCRGLQFSSSQVGPAGLKWDSAHWSCPYDSIFSILADVWLQNPIEWTARFTSINHYLGTFARGLAAVTDGSKTLENIRDEVRELLFQKDPISFHKDERRSYLDLIAKELVNTSNLLTQIDVDCDQCGFQQVDGALGYHILVDFVLQGGNTAQGINNRQTKRKERCHICRVRSDARELFNDAPNILMMETSTLGQQPYIPSKTIKVLYGENRSTTLALRGIVYWIPQIHFVARIITKDKEVWYTDGMVNDGKPEFERKLSEFRITELAWHDDKPAALAIYARQ
jgi:hypothetical protein